MIDLSLDQTLTNQTDSGRDAAPINNDMVTVGGERKQDDECNTVSLSPHFDLVT